MRDCWAKVLATCFPASSLGVSTPVLVSQHLILNAKKCLNVKPTSLLTSLGEIEGCVAIARLQDVVPTGSTHKRISLMCDDARDGGVGRDC